MRRAKNTKNQNIFEKSKKSKKTKLFCSEKKSKKKNCFAHSKKIKKGYRIIKNDYFGVRNGQVMRCFESKNEIEKSFKYKFKKFVHSSIDIDWFGLEYHWHVFIAIKK